MTRATDRSSFPNTVIFTPPAPPNEGAARLRTLLDDIGYSRHKALLEQALAEATQEAARRAEGLEMIVRDLAELSSADSPEFRDPGWEDSVRALIRRAIAEVTEDTP